MYYPYKPITVPLYFENQLAFNNVHIYLILNFKSGPIFSCLSCKLFTNVTKRYFQIFHYHYFIVTCASLFTILFYLLYIYKHIFCSYFYYIIYLIICKCNKSFKYYLPMHEYNHIHLYIWKFAPLIFMLMCMFPCLACIMVSFYTCLVWLISLFKYLLTYLFLDPYPTNLYLFIVIYAPNVKTTIYYPIVCSYAIKFRNECSR